MKILFLSRWFPYPPNNGARLRIFHLLQGLVRLHEVHLISFSDQPGVDLAAGPKTGCHSVRTVQWNEFNPFSRRAFRGIFSAMPRSLIDTYSAEMEQEISRALMGTRFDLIIASEWQMTAYRQCFGDVPVLLEEIELGVPHSRYANARSMLQRVAYGLTWYKHSRFIASLLADNQPCTVVSEQEKRLLSAIAPQNTAIEVISNGVDLAAYEKYQGEPEPDSLIFTGAFRYRVNYHAMVWFLERVFPLVRAQIPGARLTITGDHTGLPLPQSEGVTLTGQVDDVRALIARSWASIVPLLVGGGTRLKILEAMALRVPVISTSKGAEGLDALDGVHLLIADTPEAFAARVVQLLRDRALRDRLAANAHDLIRDAYDWKVIMPNFLSVVENAAARGNHVR